MNNISKQTKFWKRKVGYYEIKWKIENFTFAFRDGKNSLKTGIFWLTGKMLTKWRLKLDIQISDGEPQLILFIQMIPPTYIPKNRVWTHWKTWIRCMTNGKEEEYFIEEFKHVFELGQSYECHKLPIGRMLFNNFKPFEKDIFTIRLLVLYNDTYGEPCYGRTLCPAGLLSLSNDMIGKVNSSSSYDLMLKNNIMTIGVHKTFLYYRNDVLRRKIDNDCVDGVIHLQDKGGYELGSIVRYFYTGKFECFMHEPTFAKLELAQYLNIEEINNWFVMDRYSIESKYDVIDFIFPWIIKDYSSKTGVLAHTIRTRGKNSLPFPITLVFYTYKYGTTEFTAFYVDDVKSSLPFITFMQVSVGRGMFTWVNATELIRTLQRGMEFGEGQFASKKLIMSCLVNDTLKLRFHLKACWNSTWKTQYDAMNNTFQRTDVDFYKKLSLDMTRMLDEGKFSDLRITIKNREWTVHACILSARSKAFVERSEKSVTTFQKIQPHIFDKFIRYIYSGVLEISMIRDLIEIYDLALRHRMTILCKICTDRLKEMISVETVTDIFNFADEHDMVSLKNAVVEYVREKSPEISEDPVWKHLLTLDLSSRKRVRRFLDKDNLLETKLKPIMKIE